MRIYLSGPISGLTIQAARTRFHYQERSAKLLYPRATIINPMRITPFLWIHRWTFHMIADIAYLLTCDTVIFLKDWEKSRGAKIEHKIAVFLRKKLIYRS